jgi:hypothetical protein
MKLRKDCRLGKYFRRRVVTVLRIVTVGRTYDARLVSYVFIVRLPYRTTFCLTRFLHKICSNGGQPPDRNAVKHHNPGSRSAPWVTDSHSTTQPQRGWTARTSVNVQPRWGCWKRMVDLPRVRGIRRDPGLCCRTPSALGTLLNAVGVRNVVERLRR